MEGWQAGWDAPALRELPNPTISPALYTPQGLQRVTGDAPKSSVSGGRDYGVCGREDSVIYSGPYGRVFGGRLSGSADSPFPYPQLVGDGGPGLP